MKLSKIVSISKTNITNDLVIRSDNRIKSINSTVSQDRVLILNDLNESQNH